MTVLSDKWIKKAAQKGMIKPFVNSQVRKGKISFGLSSYGYDARVSNEFKIFTNVNSGIVDPKVFKKESFVTKIGKECIIPPNSFALARTMEYFKIPDDVLVICLGKSTYARCGIIVNVTPLEPGWEGYVTLEFSNTTSGILNFSTVLAKTNEFGGMIHSETFFVTKFVGLKFFGSTISELTLVKILNSSETLASYPNDDSP